MRSLGGVLNGEEGYGDRSLAIKAISMREGGDAGRVVSRCQRVREPEPE